MLSVEGRFYCQPAALENVGVDHGGFDVFMPEEFLNGSYIVSALEEVGCEGVAESVRGDALANIGDLLGFANGTLECGFVNVVTGCFSGLRVGVKSVCGEDVLPEPVFAGGWVFLGEGVGKVDFAQPGGQVFVVELPNALEVFAERGDDAVG